MQKSIRHTSFGQVPSLHKETIRPPRKPPIRLTSLFGNIETPNGRGVSEAGLKFLKENFPPFVIEIIDTPEFIRLKNICQMGVSYTALGSSQTHSRYVHSIHAAMIAELVCNEFGYSKEDPLRNLLIATMLVHDIGHLPFHHIGEGILASAGIEYDHDLKTAELLRSGTSKICKILKKHRISPQVVARILEDSHQNRSLVSLKDVCDRVSYCHEDIMSSKLDRKFRDKCVTALEGFLDSLSVINSQLACDDRKKAENFMRVRHSVFGLLSFSPPAQLGTSVISKAIKQSNLDLTNFHNMNETEVIEYLLKNSKTQKIVNKLMDPRGIEAHYEAICMLPLSAFTSDGRARITGEISLQESVMDVFGRLVFKDKAWITPEIKSAISAYLEDPSSCQEIHVCITPDYGKKFSILVPDVFNKKGNKLEEIKIDATDNTRFFMVFISKDILPSIDVAKASSRFKKFLGKLIKPERKTSSDIQAQNWREIDFMLENWAPFSIF